MLSPLHEIIRPVRTAGVVNTAIVYLRAVKITLKLLGNSNFNENDVIVHPSCDVKHLIHAISTQLKKNVDHILLWTLDSSCHPMAPLSDSLLMPMMMRSNNLTLGIQLSDSHDDNIRPIQSSELSDVDSDDDLESLVIVEF